MKEISTGILIHIQIHILIDTHIIVQNVLRLALQPGGGVEKMAKLFTKH